MVKMKDEFDLTIRAMCLPEKNGDMKFLGFLFGRDGSHLGDVRGTLPSQLVDVRPARRRGRPKDEARKVAFFLHEQMALSMNDEGDEPKTSARCRVAAAMNVGGDQKDAADYVRRHAKHVDVKAALSKTRSIVLFGGDSDGSGRGGMAIEYSRLIADSGGVLTIRLRGWICSWGSQQAKYGDVTSSAHTPAERATCLKLLHGLGENEASKFTA